MKLLPAVGLTIAGLFVLSKVMTASAASRINFTLGNIGISSSGITPIVQLTVLAQNPTDKSITISSIVGNVLLNGQLIGNIPPVGFPITVAANSQSQIPISVMLQGLSLISDVVSMLSGTAGLSAVVSLTGTVNVDGLLLPLNLSYRII